MPRKRELDRLRERARLDPVFAAEWKAKKLAEDKARRDAKLSPEYRAAREWRRAHPEEHRRNIQKAADDRRKEERRAYYASDLRIEKQEELRRRRAKRDAWHLLNPGVLYTTQKAMTKEERRDYSRKSSLRSAGWTPESFALAKHEQSNRCAICGETPEIKQKEAIEALVPDHKHGKPPVPRALLCPGCNSALGLLKDSPERCEAAAAYLRRFPYGNIPASPLGYTHG
jgi:hypothetical protein